MSIKRGRPTTANTTEASMSPNKNRTHSISWKQLKSDTYLSQVKIIQELNGANIKAQDKDVEIERLQTTCFTLNSKVLNSDDMQLEI
jgi:hypothetical protein